MSTTVIRAPRSSSVVMLALAALCFTAAPGARASETSMEDAQLVELSRTAATPQQHAQAAKQYRLRAEALEAQATQAEMVATRALSSQPPLRYKFPSAFSASLDQDKQRAIQARRSAQEARNLAHWHLSRAVEIFFGQ